MLGAGLVATKAVQKGLTVKPYVKSSLTPGSKVVTEYLEKAGLFDSLSKLGFYVAGYGCATCIGNSGPLPDEVSQAIDDNDLTVASVLSGNRNFEGRIHPDVKANYLASPPLVVAYALAGTVNIDFDNDPIGYDPDGNPVYLKDIWPTNEEIRQSVAASMNAGSIPETVCECLRRQRTLEPDGYAEGRTLRVGRRIHLYPGAAVLHRPVS